MTANERAGPARRSGVVGLTVTAVIAAAVVFLVWRSSQAFLPTPDEARDRLIGIVEEQEQRSGVTGTCAPRPEEEAIDCQLRDAAGTRGWGTAEIVDRKIERGSRDRYVENVRFTWDFPLDPDGVLVAEFRDDRGDGSLAPTDVVIRLMIALRAVGLQNELVWTRCPPVAVGATVACPVDPSRTLHPVAGQVTVEITRLAPDRLRLRAVVPLPP